MLRSSSTSWRTLASNDGKLSAPGGALESNSRTCK
uniref:Uncharacterized protein n=1 Tax=Ciona intestinalis TaxID=7719 RepID=H2XV29_CIOIN